MTPAIATEVHRLAAEGLSQRQIAELTGCTRPAVARVLRAAPPADSDPPAAPAPAEPAPATDLESEIYGPAPAPATKPRRARVEPAPEPLSPMQLARLERERLDAVLAEKTRLAVEAHGYRGAPPRSGWTNSTSTMGPGGRGRR